MHLKTLQSIDLQGKTILYRAPYDIDVKEANGVLEVEDDPKYGEQNRIVGYLPPPAPAFRNPVAAQPQSNPEDSTIPF